MTLTAEQISKKYFRKSGGANWFYAVQPLSITLRQGNVTLLCGRSGSGKTTLLHMLAGLLTPSEGSVRLDRTELYALTDGELSRLRNRAIGVIPQGRSVLDVLTVRENILLPGVLWDAEQRDRDAERWMAMLKIDALADSRAAELSGGELRRTAIARTLSMQPAVILADEPTADLDDENTKLVFGCFRRAADEGAAVLIVSHEADALNYADAVYRMDGGSMTALTAK